MDFIMAVSAEHNIPTILTDNKHKKNSNYHHEFTNLFHGNIALFSKDQQAVQLAPDDANIPGIVFHGTVGLLAFDPS